MSGPYYDLRTRKVGGRFYYKIALFDPLESCSEALKGFTDLHLVSNFESFVILSDICELLIIENTDGKVNTSVSDVLEHLQRTNTTNVQNVDLRAALDEAFSELKYDSSIVLPETYAKAVQKMSTKELLNDSHDKSTEIGSPINVSIKDVEDEDESSVSSDTEGEDEYVTVYVVTYETCEVSYHLFLPTF